MELGFGFPSRNLSIPFNVRWDTGDGCVYKPPEIHMNCFRMGKWSLIYQLSVENYEYLDKSTTLAIRQVVHRGWPLRNLMAMGKCCIMKSEKRKAIVIEIEIGHFAQLAVQMCVLWTVFLRLFFFFWFCIFVFFSVSWWKVVIVGCVDCCCCCLSLKRRQDVSASCHALVQFWQPFGSISCQLKTI